MKEDNEIIKQIDKYLVTVCIVAITVAIFFLVVSNKFEVIRLGKEYQKLTGYLDYQSIFQKYLDQKRDLYINFNQKLYSSSNKTFYEKYYGKFGGIFAPLFSGFKGVWGWDKQRLDDRYDNSFIVKDVFIHDLDYWNSKGRKEREDRWKNIPKDSMYFNVYRNLRKYCNDRNYLASFFAQNYFLKVQLLKDLLKSSNIRASINDTLPLSINQTSMMDNKQHDLERSLVAYVNDSVKTQFHMLSLFYMFYLEDENYFYNMNDIHESIIDLFYTKYIFNRLSEVDSNYFDSKLPYSAYYEYRERRKDNIYKLLQREVNLSTDVKPPYIPFEIDIRYFAGSVLWILCAFQYFSYQLLKHRHSIMMNDKYQKGNRVKLNPTFINLIFDEKHKFVIIVIAVVFIVLNLTISIELYQSRDVLLIKPVIQLFLFLLPLIVIVYLNILKGLLVFKKV